MRGRLLWFRYRATDHAVVKESQGETMKNAGDRAGVLFCEFVGRWLSGLAMRVA